MSQNQFAKLIKSLQREVTEEKTVRRRSSLTLETITKNIAVNCTIHRSSGSRIICTYAGLVRIAFPDGITQLVTPTIVNANGRGLEFHNFNIDDGAGIIVEPTAGETWDSDIAIGGDKTIQVTIGVTSTGDFELTTDQIYITEP